MEKIIQAETRAEKALSVAKKIFKNLEDDLKLLEGIFLKENLKKIYIRFCRKWS